MPTPKKDESKDDFISRCIPYVIDEGTADDTEQATAICNSIWKRSKEEETHNMKKERKLFHLDAKLTGHVNLDDKEGLELDQCTILVGDGTYNGVFFPTEEVEKFYKDFEGKPINLNHNDDRVEDIVGFLKNLRLDGKKIVAEPYLDENTAKYKEALGFIKTRFAAGDIPNVSIGIWIDLEREEINDTGESRLVARNGEPDHLALVVHGACNPNDGCGIGLSDTNSIYTVSSDDKYIWLTNDMFMENTLDEQGNPKLFWKVDFSEEDEKEKLKKEIIKEQIKMEENLNE